MSKRISSLVEHLKRAHSIITSESSLVRENMSEIRPLFMQLDKALTPLMFKELKPVTPRLMEPYTAVKTSKNPVADKPASARGSDRNTAGKEEKKQPQSRPQTSSKAPSSKNQGSEKGGAASPQRTRSKQQSAGSRDSIGDALNQAMRAVEERAEAKHSPKQQQQQRGGGGGGSRRPRVTVHYTKDGATRIDDCHRLRAERRLDKLSCDRMRSYLKAYGKLTTGNKGAVQERLEQLLDEQLEEAGGERDRVPPPPEVARPPARVVKRRREPPEETRRVRPLRIPPPTPPQHREPGEFSDLEEQVEPAPKRARQHRRVEDESSSSSEYNDDGRLSGRRTVSTRRKVAEWQAGLQPPEL
eukprot:TRINITY_DN2688_c2_g1_i1.p1 TRINITY_DN2688_c2_g1~~TRINITY_DN2688_c2_g1_i1.p1  ORF type:complete len:357 (+),score=128.50 TRINITY_DN2688_c2_g1_i1:77-1147(+)